MKAIVHLLDDPALGGVTRLLDSLMQSLGSDFRQEKLLVKTGFRLPPVIDADVIVIHFTLAWRKLLFLLGLRLLSPRSRLILVEHSYTACFESAYVLKPGRFRTMLRLGYRCVDRIVSVSQGQARWITGAGLAAASKLSVIPCILDLGPFEQLAPPEPVIGQTMILGAYGRFHVQKGFDTLIAAMRMVPRDTARLELAGFGPEDNVLRAQAADIPGVAIRGRVDPLIFLCEIDAVAMPSRWEAGAVSCWEARAAGRPVIVSDVDGLPEQAPAEIGIVVPPENPRALADAIIRLAEADRTALSVAARRSTAHAFERTVASWQELLDDVRDDRRRFELTRMRSPVTEP
jgi:glycosyltransferase involved in cell wall biosynthesis